MPSTLGKSSKAGNLYSEVSVILWSFHLAVFLCGSISIGIYFAVLLADDDSTL